MSVKCRSNATRDRITLFGIAKLVALTCEASKRQDYTAISRVSSAQKLKASDATVGQAIEILLKQERLPILLTGRIDRFYRDAPMHLSLRLA